VHTLKLGIIKMMIFKQSKLIFLASILAILAWAELLVLIVLFIIVFFGSADAEELFMPTMIYFIGTGFLYSCMVFFIRCDTCKKCVLVQQTALHGDRKHVSAWASTAVSVVFKRKFKCMHCGSCFRLG
jgi:hypothetical protein